MEDDLKKKMEDDLKKKMEDDLKKMEDDLKINGRRPYFLFDPTKKTTSKKWKTNSKKQLKLK
jgi:hypothetical protein